MSAEDAAYAHDPRFFPQMPKLRSCTRENRRAVGLPVLKPCLAIATDSISHITSIVPLISFASSCPRVI
jgi:hypothetical protein